jgi:two-component system, OmpR family, sensor histidine kinase KdpD
MSRLRVRSSREHRAADFLELVEHARRGRLKVYLGYAAGVGKTFRMLEETHSLRQRGVDVVLGVVETHGRAETAALLAGLEAVPLRSFSYRGVTLSELDLEAVIARKPQVVIIDEVAHSNVPGSTHNKRWQDVLAILDVGINVICAFNVQHVESLNDVVFRATGVQVRETVPDTLLKQADQIVTLDLDVLDLLDRLRAGKIYTEDKIPWALSHFFQERNLANLRELVLREVADSLDRSGAARSAAQEPAASWGGKLMVCLSSNPPHARTLLRRGSRLAGRLCTAWYVVYVETPKEAPDVIDSTAQRYLLANIELAKELGAEVVRLEGTDPVVTLLEFARAHGVSDVVIGRTQDSLLRQALLRSFTSRMIRRAAGLDLHIVSFRGASEESRPADPEFAGKEDS